MSAKDKQGFSLYFLIAFGPVSYTHLDVYKRQVHCVWTLKNHGCEAILVNNNPETVSTAVSYTHLDVYKRQVHSSMAGSMLPSRAAS